MGTMVDGPVRSSAQATRASRWLIDIRAQFLVTPDDPPMFFFHGEQDQLVPLISPALMQQELQRAGVQAELYIIPKVGHMAASFDRTAIERAIAFLASHLQKQGE